MLETQELLPGFREGYDKIHRDEHRHIAYGTWFLQHAVAADPALAAVVRATLVDLLPAVAESLQTPEGADASALGATTDELRAFALSGLTRVGWPSSASRSRPCSRSADPPRNRRRPTRRLRDLQPRHRRTHRHVRDPAEDRRRPRGLGRRRTPLCLADDHDRILGWARASAYSDRCVYSGVGEHAVYVDPAARGQQLGRQLLEALAAEAERRGVYKLTSRIFSDNHANRAAHRAAGFTEAGLQRRHRKLDEQWKDCVLVERLLGHAAHDDRP